ncbi:glycosyltransferase family A protein [Algoriphagus sediminis]|uniref:Glycosyltransferase n=1 Tax=Algoriphagus sediminis TaxID=3057113 RepID=A0ABT7Y8Q3_9BACT|nr:glycosyltransferase family 2 protein [Algoriphagus sediminis]MDN3202877.1 glycosyltransferase [Algoriphagus sediminis]
MLISVIMEWENALLSELGRTEEMLISFFSQARKLHHEFEIIIVHDPNLVTGDFIQDFIKSSVPDLSRSELSKLRLIERQGLHYFAFKNIGIQEANGESVICLDSDVIPEDNWLEKLIDSHEENDKAVIGGLTYIDYSNFMGKCFGLCWFFPKRTKLDVVVPSNIIFSNNFIARKKLLCENPYPDLDGKATRGADVLLWRRLLEKGVGIFMNLGAKVSHPPPNGVKHFFVRGLAEGRDEYYQLKETTGHDKIPEIQFFKIYSIKSWKVIKSTFTEGALVNLKWYEAPFAMMVMLFYYLLFLVGGISTMLFPKATNRVWQI